MSSSILKPGFRLGKYEVLAHIATGGMGAVYKATDLELRRIVALKVLPSRTARRPDLLERFRREARHAARLSHKHIVTLFECGYDAGHDLHYLALEFVDGIDLEEYIRRRGRLPPAEARHILMQAAKALEHAFERGVIHRDIKPSNFLLAQVSKRAVVKLTDLGLARVADDDDFKVTRDGSTVGTIDYLSPEQARDSRAADIRSDIYSLGCTAYHMLAGKAPFAEGGLGERLFKHLEVVPPDVRQFNPAVSAAFWGVLQKMLAKKPEERHATPADLLRDLRHIRPEVSAEDAPRRPRRDPAGRRETDLVPSPPTEAYLPATANVPPPAPREPTPRPEPSRTPAAAASSSPDTAERQRAAAFHERALRVLAEGGGGAYARELLASCLKLDPFNTEYRRALREANHKAAGGVLGRLVGSLNVLALKSRMRLARSRGEWRKVLVQGEDVLARQPADVEAHLEMAEAAAALGLPALALWLLEQGREQAPDNADLVRALAGHYEGVKDWKHALALWEEVRRLVPDDDEVRRKINDLAAEAHIARGTMRP